MLSNFSARLLFEYNIVFQEQFFQQRDGWPMGSPCSSVCANAYMQFFERVRTQEGSRLYRYVMYVDDTFVVDKIAFVEEFTDHINRQDKKNIQTNKQTNKQKQK